MSDDDKKYKTGLRAIAAFEESSVFKAMSIGVNGGLKTCHSGGAKVGHLVQRLGA